MNEIPVLLLAAGGSTRMGQSKQLLSWGNTTLIEHQIKTLIATEYPVNVILGSDSDLIIPHIEKYPVSIFINSEWERGMGSSVSQGILEVSQKYPIADGVLICLLDQPLVTSFHLKKMIDAWKPGCQQIVASKSASGWIGVPVIFDKCYFNDLSELKDDEGAKKIIRQNEEQVITVEAGDLIEDIDTTESYQQLWHKYSAK